MTKRDLELIARVITCGFSTRNGVIAQLVIAKQFADEFAKSNRQFNHKKFLRACGATPSA
jgi:hypothetical protein